MNDESTSHDVNTIVSLFDLKEKKKYYLYSTLCFCSNPSNIIKIYSSRYYILSEYLYARVYNESFKKESDLYRYPIDDYFHLFECKILLHGMLVIIKDDIGFHYLNNLISLRDRKGKSKNMSYLFFAYLLNLRTIRGRDIMMNKI